MKEFSTNKPDRLYYLDWLRVLAFSILLFEHCAEIFVPWHFWVKNPDVSAPLGYFITLLKPWRMPLLFIISGAAVFLACKRKTSVEIFKERSLRILLPLLAAMILVIPSQIYIIKLQEGYNGSYLEFYRTVFDFHWFPAGSIHWLHLWYLAFIFIFTLAIIPILPVLRTTKIKGFLDALDQKLAKPFALLLAGVVMSIPFFLARTFSGQGNLTQLTFYFPYFLFGLTIFTRGRMQDTIIKNRGVFLLLAICTTTLLFSLSPRLTEGESFVRQAVNYGGSSVSILLIQTLNTWLSVLAILGYGIRFLNFKSPGLAYANEAVYPFYILHQTVIVVTGYYVTRFNGSIPWKLFLITAISLCAIWLFYEFVIKRTLVTRMLFGLKAVAPQPISRKKEDLDQQGGPGLFEEHPREATELSTILTNTLEVK